MGDGAAGFGPDLSGWAPINGRAFRPRGRRCKSQFAIRINVDVIVRGIPRLGLSCPWLLELTTDLGLCRIAEEQYSQFHEGGMDMGAALAESFYGLKNTATASVGEGY